MKRQIKKKCQTKLQDTSPVLSRGDGPLMNDSLGREGFTSYSKFSKSAARAAKRARRFALRELSSKFSVDGELKFS